MKKKILLLFICIFLFGCSKKIEKEEREKEERQKKANKK